MRRWLSLPLVLLLACCTQAAAADFPRIPSGISCTARTVVDGKAVEVELRLLNNNVFVLQTLARQGEKVAMQVDVSGSWRQSGDGAQLLLDNPFGFHQRAAVGGRGAIYLDIPPWPGAPAVFFVLEQEPLRMTPVRLMGVLHAGGDGRPVLRESGSGQDFAVEGLPAGQTPDLPAFVELSARIRHDGLVVESLRAQSARIPSGLEAERDFAAVCGETVWLLEQQEAARPVTCTFLAQSPHEGRVELVAPGLHAAARYVLGPRNAIRFDLRDDERRSLQLLQETAVLQLLDATSWKTVGDSLALRDAGGRTVFLVPHTARTLSRANPSSHGIPR